MHDHQEGRHNYLQVDENRYGHILAHKKKNILKQACITWLVRYKTIVLYTSI